MPWYLWITLGGIFGAIGGVYLGMVLSAAGADSAKYSDGYLP